MRLTLLAALLLALAPTVLASWSTSPASPQEPSTAWDTWGGWMWHDPPAPFGGPRLYFESRYVASSLASPLPHYEATLGVWSDCNSDGIVGIAAGETYASVLLLDLSVCPPGTPHNDGSTVRELRVIGPGATAPHIADASARIWLDRALPTEPATPVKTFADHVYSFSAANARWTSVGSAGIESDHATAYAYVSPAILGAYGIQTPNGGYLGAYGEENCMGFTSGVFNGWDCDPSSWLTAPRVYDPYVLRDVDCLSAC